MLSYYSSRFSNYEEVYSSVTGTNISLRATNCILNKPKKQAAFATPYQSDFKPPLLLLDAPPTDLSLCQCRHFPLPSDRPAHSSRKICKTAHTGQTHTRSVGETPRKPTSRHQSKQRDDTSLQKRLYFPCGG